MGGMNLRTILHIDMNSYFATVEQQANPYLRGKPVGVKGSHAKRTIIAAASVEAKKFGVKTAMPEHEARKICPDLIVVVGEPRKYSFVTKKFIEIFDRYTDVVEIFSIDEAFLDVTETAKFFGGAEKLARSIKNDIRNEIGEWLTCSVGIGPNKFLAKLGSDLEKPDGLVIINEKNKDEILLSCELTDFCGIANRIEKRLNYLNIFSVSDLRNADDFVLKKEFGVYGLKIKRMAWGIDSSKVGVWQDQPDAKSFGHSRTLNKDVTKKDEMLGQLYLLSEKVAKRMRNEGYFGKEVGIWIRYKDFTGAGKRHRIGYWINDGHEIFRAASEILDTLNIWQPVRAMGVYVKRITKDVPYSLFEKDRKGEKMLEMMDEINNKYGEETLFKGTLLNFPFKKIVSGMGRKKF